MQELLVSTYHSWLVLGFILIALELILPGMIIIFFGAGALVTGALLFFLPLMPLFYQLLIFIIVSVVSLILLRRFTPVSGKKIDAEKDVDYDDEIIGKIVNVIETIPAGNIGKIELDGSNWNAICDKEIAVGTRVIIISRDGLTLSVKPLN